MSLHGIQRLIISLANLSIPRNHTFSWRSALSLLDLGGSHVQCLSLAVAKIPVQRVASHGEQYSVEQQSGRPL